MKIWEFAKVEGSSIKVDSWMSDTMGLVDGGIVYSTLFKHPAEGPKDYEIILSMFPQENYRTLTHVTMYLDDVPGSSAQAARFLASREINILNSISLNGISDTVIVWKLMADMNFAGEGDILREEFESLKARNDPSVSKIRRIDIKPAEIGRLFKGARAPGGKEEVRRGYPSAIKDGAFDVSDQYGDILSGIDGQNVLITMDADAWILSITFFKQGTRLVRAGLEMPDCPGGIEQVLNVIAGWNVNLISVFSKVKICYETMYLELVMDIGKSELTSEEIRERLPGSLDGLNGIYTVREFTELK
ncbi:MAG: ACT domain protein [Thermoplasmata archaeon]|nr:ACT domain protein [Thermoplasmata archaeon]